MKNTDLISMLYRCMPNSDQIRLQTIDPKEIRFEWRGNHFRVQESLFTEQIDGKLLVGSDLAAMLEMLLKKQLVLDGH